MIKGVINHKDRGLRSQAEIFVALSNLDQKEENVHCSSIPLLIQLSNSKEESGKYFAGHLTQFNTAGASIKELLPIVLYHVH